MADLAQERLARRSSGPLAERVHLKNTNPTLYWSLMMIAIADIALGFNFLFANVTFEQFDIPQEWIGMGFLLIGLPKLVFLNFRRNVKAVRIMLIAGMVYYLTWGVGTTETFFTGDSSLQLFILYWTLAGLRVPLLLEPFFNPVTANGVETDE